MIAVVLAAALVLGTGQQPEAAPTPKPHFVDVFLKKDGSLLADGRPETTPGLRERIARGERVLVHSDPNITYQRFSAFMNALGSDSYYSVAIVGGDASSKKP